VGLFRRDKPLHEQLAEQAGLDLGAGTGFGDARATPPAEPAAPTESLWNDQQRDEKQQNDKPQSEKQWDEKPPGSEMSGSEMSGGPGVHGLARSRRWDTVVVAEAPALTGDSVAFVALPDGTLVVDEDEPDDSLAPLADAIEASIRPPYRAEGVRQSRSRWSVGAVRITVVEAPGVDGEEAELITNAESSTLTIDGRSVYGSVPAFERAGEAHGSTYVVRAERIDGELWQVEALPL
jgi:hypothetical protein